MAKQKLKLNEEIVKYIFPGLHPKITSREDGWIAYDFDHEIPRKLGIMVPIEVESSNYNRVFPVSFNGYFKKLGDITARFSRLLETPINLSIPDAEVEAIAGGLFVYKSKYTVFRFDEFLDTADKKYLLCRARAKQLSVNETVDILNAQPVFLEETVGLDGAEYIYFLIPTVSIFSEPMRILLAAFAYAEKLKPL